jgi:hypothetical protein
MAVADPRVNGEVYRPGCSKLKEIQPHKLPRTIRFPSFAALVSQAAFASDSSKQDRSDSQHERKPRVRLLPPRHDGPIRQGFQEACG